MDHPEAPQRGGPRSTSAASTTVSTSSSSRKCGQAYPDGSVVLVCPLPDKAHFRRAGRVSRGMPCASLAGPKMSHPTCREPPDRGDEPAKALGVPGGRPAGRCCRPAADRRRRRPSRPCSIWDAAAASRGDVERLFTADDPGVFRSRSEQHRSTGRRGEQCCRGALSRAERSDRAAPRARQPLEVAGASPDPDAPRGTVRLPLPPGIAPAHPAPAPRQSAGGAAVNPVDMDGVAVRELIAERPAGDRHAAGLPEPGRGCVSRDRGARWCRTRPPVPRSGRDVELTVAPLDHQPDRRSGRGAGRRSSARSARGAYSCYSRVQSARPT